MELLCQNIGITTVKDEITEKALANSKVHDFEDGLEYYSALKSKCDFIITENQEDFYFSEIEVLGCWEFIKRLYPLNINHFLCHSTVNNKVLSCDKIIFRIEQKQNHVGNVSCFSNSSGRMLQMIQF